MDIFLKKSKKIFLLIFFLGLLSFPNNLFAVSVKKSLKTQTLKPRSSATENLIYVAEDDKVGGYGDIDNTMNTSLFELIGQVVSIFLGFLGMIFIILTIYAGFTYMTAQGSEEKTKKALDTLRTALIGLAIVVGSYGIYKAISVIL